MLLILKTIAFIFSLKIFAVSLLSFVFIFILFSLFTKYKTNKNKTTIKKPNTDFESKKYSKKFNYIL